MPPPQPVKKSPERHFSDSPAQSTLQLQKGTPEPTASSSSGGPLLENEQGSAEKRPGSPTLTKAQLEVLADLETLSAASKPKEVDEAEANPCNWKPPEGQSGDGKTHLNARFGY